jgi:hypothetical protein
MPLPSLNTKEPIKLNYKKDSKLYKIKILSSLIKINKNNYTNKVMYYSKLLSKNNKEPISMIMDSYKDKKNIKISHSKKITNLINLYQYHKKTNKLLLTYLIHSM